MAAAATSATIVVTAGTSLVLSPPGQLVALPPQRLSFGKFNGLKVSPALRQRAVVVSSSSPVDARIFTIRATAKPDTLSTVQGIIAEQLQVNREQVAPEAKFADLGADSLDTVEIIMALEEQFKIHLDEDGAQKIATVQDAADMIQNTITEAAQSPAQSA